MAMEIPGRLPEAATHAHAGPATKRARSPGALLSKVAAYAAVAVLGVVSLFPLYWMIVTSLRPTSDAESGVVLWPEKFQWSNFANMWTALEYPFHVYLINSFVLSVLVTLGAAISSVIVAYGFARFEFPGRDWIFAVIIGTMMIPFAVMMIPQYALMVNVFRWGGGGSIGSYHNLLQFLPQIVPAYHGSPLFIFLLRQFIRGIPRDLDEAAEVDGAGPVRILWNVILPELRPALAAVVVLTFIGKWNDFLGPVIYLQDPHNWTVELALNQFVTRYGTSIANYQMAGACMSMLPIIVIFFLASKQIIQGITLSGVKG